MRLHGRLLRFVVYLIAARSPMWDGGTRLKLVLLQFSGTMDASVRTELPMMKMDSSWMQEQPMIPFAELKIPKACDYVSKKTLSRFVCERCNRSYMRKDSLQRHVQWECGKEPQFHCPFCPQRCKRKAHWQRHIRRQHSEKLGGAEEYLHSYTPKMEID